MTLAGAGGRDAPATPFGAAAAEVWRDQGTPGWGAQGGGRRGDAAAAYNGEAAGAGTPSGVIPRAPVEVRDVAGVDLGVPNDVFEEAYAARNPPPYPLSILEDRIEEKEGEEGASAGEEERDGEEEDEEEEEEEDGDEDEDDEATEDEEGAAAGGGDAAQAGEKEGALGHPEECRNPEWAAFFSKGGGVKEAKGGGMKLLVTCGGLEAEFDVATAMFKYMGKAMSGSQFECEAGSQAKKWKNSIRVVDPDTRREVCSLEHWGKFMLKPGEPGSQFLHKGGGGNRQVNPEAARKRAEKELKRREWKAKMAARREERLRDPVLAAQRDATRKWLEDRQRARERFVREKVRGLPLKRQRSGRKYNPHDSDTPDSEDEHGRPFDPFENGVYDEREAKAARRRRLQRLAAGEDSESGEDWGGVRGGRDIGAMLEARIANLRPGLLSRPPQDVVDAWKFWMGTGSAGGGALATSS